MYSNNKERYLNRGYITSTKKTALVGITTKELMNVIRSGKYRHEYIRVTPEMSVFPTERNREVSHV